MNNKKRWFTTGDKHREFSDVKKFCIQAETTQDDVLIILGDAGIDYTLKDDDIYLKRWLTKLPITLIMVRGNHEAHPREVSGYNLIDSPFNEGKVWHDNRFENQFVFEDGLHIINGKSVVVAGGAYSVDKQYRLVTGKKWFASEQMDDNIKQQILNAAASKHFDYVFTHTCPFSYIPRDVFLPMIDQKTVDNSMEQYLQILHDSIDYNEWYCAHYHTDRVIDKIYFLFHAFKQII